MDNQEFYGALCAAISNLQRRVAELEGVPHKQALKASLNEFEDLLRLAHADEAVIQSTLRHLNKL